MSAKAAPSGRRNRFVRRLGLFSLGALLVFPLVSGCESRQADALIVTKVFDGDTVLLSSGDKVRLIGIDCPEAYESEKLFRDARRTHNDVEVIKAQGRQAKEVMVKLAQGKRVMLEYDVERRDQYGRLLAYVYVPLASSSTRDAEMFVTEKDGAPCIFLNASLLMMGYASPMTIPPNTRYADLFKSLHHKARQGRKGLYR
ncbi:MAG TPA: thermonuclease family protein [Candidatus Omnitrophota bacterium]|nr:thermonuclease family protein [Candidatus Omnitrophota bacterium]HQP12897.1 thermonuclease family protein [Candidatus Omnitrophota bacterium]